MFSLLVYLPEQVEKFDQKFEQSGNQGNPFDPSDGEEDQDQGEERTETHHRYDVKLIGVDGNDNKYIELKSYSISSINNLHNAKSFRPTEQFGQYLHHTTDINNLRYTFNKRKLPQLSEDDAILAIKNQFRRLMGAEYVNGNGELVEEDLVEAQKFVNVMHSDLKISLGISQNEESTYIQGIEALIDTIIYVE